MTRGLLGPGPLRLPEALASIFRSWDFCRDVGGPWWPRLDSDPSPSGGGQRWLMGLKAPDSGVAPAMFNQASRGLWEEVWRGASSERDSIIAYAWRERAGHTRDGQVSGAGCGPADPRPAPSPPGLPPALAGLSSRGR